MPGTISIQVTGDEDLRDFYRRTRLFRRNLRGALHEEYTAAAESVAEAARRNALAARFPAARPARRPWPARSTGLRAGLAASVQVRVRRAGGGVEARVVSRHPMAAPTDGRWGDTWRHPVMGNRRAAWVAQRSFPWFSRAREEAAPAAREAASGAAQRALAGLSRRGGGLLGRLFGR